MLVDHLLRQVDALGPESVALIVRQPADGRRHSIFRGQVLSQARPLTSRFPNGQIPHDGRTAVNGISGAHSAPPGRSRKPAARRHQRPLSGRRWPCTAPNRISPNRLTASARSAHDLRRWLRQEHGNDDGHRHHPNKRKYKDFRDSHGFAPGSRFATFAYILFHQGKMKYMPRPANLTLPTRGSGQHGPRTRYPAGETTSNGP